MTTTNVRCVSKQPAGKGVRRLRRLVVLGALVGGVAAVRRVLIDRDQRAFDARYGPSSEG